MKALIYLTLLMSMATTYALEVDEKLTLRFLKVSATKKTVLINRGAEDGLVVGNHAKFFTTAGVIARGVAEKVSPSRSIWSLYRVVDAGEISDDKVLNLKIGTPVKITEDASKSLKDEVIPLNTEKKSQPDVKKESKAEVDSFDTDAEEPMPVKDGKTGNSSQSNKNMPSILESSVSTDKEWDVWGNASANMLTGTASNINVGAAAASTTAMNSTLDYSVGIEKYFFHSNPILSQMSLTGFYHGRNAKMGHDIQITENLTEFGVGVRYHFNQSVSVINGIIPFALFDVGMGNVTLQRDVISTTTQSDPALKGTSRFFAVGGGAKYILGMGLGFKTILDYYSSNETYAYSAATGTRALSGVRLQMGLSYRF
jgi:hypothetical protein